MRLQHTFCTVTWACTHAVFSRFHPAHAITCMRKTVSNAHNDSGTTCSNILCTCASDCCKHTIKHEPRPQVELKFRSVRALRMLSPRNL